MKNVLLLFIATTLALYSCTGKSEPKKPNILFILADDQCFNTINELGNHEVFTPTIDKLARQGTVFTTAYNMGGWNGAICIASRTMFNTGRFLWRAEAYDNQVDLGTLAEHGQLWSKEMEKLGYETFMTGKWHVKIKPEDIFTHAGTERPGMPKDTPEGYNRPQSESDTTWRPWDTSFGGFWEGGTHWSEVVANESMGFLESAASTENPFFMYIAFNAPHDPRQSPREYVDMYPLKNISLPESFLTEYPYKDDIGCGPGLRDEALAPFPRTEYAVKVNRQEYYAIITHMDAQIKRILDKLEETGQADNTYIFFTADHGLAVGHHGLMGKQNMYEHSLRPPLIIVGPDIPEGEKRDMAVYIQDIMPTVIEYAGGQVPEYVEFSSLKSFIEKTASRSNYPEVYGAYTDVQRMIRVDDYKLIVYPYAGKKRLFNLTDDPQEMHDLAADAQQSERVNGMFSRLQELMVEMNDTLQLADFFP
jgi:arylsulfatase A-like enzyme